MQLQRIRDKLGEYTPMVKATFPNWVWDVQAGFVRHWDPDAGDLAGMIDRSLQSGVSRRLWSRTSYQPKEVLLHFARMEPDQVRAMFRDLFRDDRPLAGRIDRFIYLSGELLDQYREEGRRPLLAGHDQDVGTVMLYLALRYPDQYGPYDHEAFTSALRAFQVKELPVQPDPERWVRVARTLRGIMDQDPAWSKAWQELDAGRFSNGSPWIVWDFIRYVAFGKDRLV